MTAALFSLRWICLEPGAGAAKAAEALKANTNKDLVETIFEISDLMNDKGSEK